MSDLSRELTLELIRQLPILAYATEKAVIAGRYIDGDYERQLRAATAAVHDELTTRILAAGLDGDEVTQAAAAVIDLVQSAATRARLDLAAMCLVHVPHTCGPAGLFQRAREGQLHMIRAASREALTEQRATNTLTRILHTREA